MNVLTLKTHTFVVILAMCLATFISPLASSAESSKKNIEIYSKATKAYGRGDYKVALEKYRKIAEQGHAKSQYALGWMYQYGLGTSIDYDKAIKWFRLSAAQGIARAQYNLGYLYHHAQGGVQKDLNKAHKWYRMAADQGNSFAEYELGWMYFHAQGVKKNIQTAIKYYEKAASKKFNRALNTLGSIYFSGEGVKRNNILAHMWWTIAIATKETAPNQQSKFLKGVRASLSKVEALMSDSEIAQAKELAARRLAKRN